MKYLKKFKISNKIAFLFCLCSFLLFMLFSKMAPVIFNSPPHLTSEMYKYFVLYVMLSGLIMVIIIKKIYSPLDHLKSKDFYKYTYIPHLIYVGQIVSTFFTLFGLVNENFSMIFKLFTICITYETLISISLLLISRYYIRNVLLSIDSNDISKINRLIKLNKRIIFQLAPLFLTMVLMAFSISFSRMIIDKGNVISEFLNYQLNNHFQNKKISNIYFAEELLKKVKINTTDIENNYFIIDPQGKITGKISKSALLYIHKYEDGYRFYGRTMEEQGVFIKSHGYVLGINYYLNTRSSAIFFSITFVVAFVYCIFISIYFTNQILFDIKIVTEGLNKLATGSEVFDKKLPVTSNDEVGELVIAFNKIQNHVKNHVFDLKAANEELNALNEEMIAINTELSDTLQKLQETQNQLIESEKLAFLGHLMAGIAHSLKTPLFSCSGAIRIIEEKNKNIITKIISSNLDESSMKEVKCETEGISNWNKAIEQYVLYMNEVINTVQSYAVSSEEKSFSFRDLKSSLDILMQNSLKSNGCQLIYNINVDEYKKYNGEKNSLILVLCNLVENAIQAYEKTDKCRKIDLSVYEKNNRLFISVRDYGIGIKEDIKDKLFKEFATTKGKEGTGLGLLFSRILIYKFNGNIEFENKEKGTEFFISIPTYNIKKY